MRSLRPLVFLACTATTVVGAELTVVANVVTYEPLVLFAQSGDTVTWINMIGHDTVSIDGMIPQGAKPWRSELGMRYSILVEENGVYFYKCTPHISNGMVGAIVVGDQVPTNIEAVKDAVANIPVAKNMVARVIRKVEKALRKRTSVE